MRTANRRFVVTLIVIVFLIGGAGFALVSEAYLDSTVSLQDSQLFNIWLGAILGFGGTIIAFLFNQEDKTEKPKP